MKLMKDAALNPVHPGEILLEDFLKPLGTSQYRLAKDIHVPLRRINEIVLGRRGVSADTALRLARYFKTTPRFWAALRLLRRSDTLLCLTLCKPARNSAIIRKSREMSWSPVAKQPWAGYRETLIRAPIGVARIRFGPCLWAWRAVPSS